MSKCQYIKNINLFQIEILQIGNCNQFWLYHIHAHKVLVDGVQLNSDNFFFILMMREESMQAPQKAGHHRPASETPLN